MLSKLIGGKMSAAKRKMFEEMDKTCGECGEDKNPQDDVCNECNEKMNQERIEQMKEMAEMSMADAEKNKYKTVETCIYDPDNIVNWFSLIAQTSVPVPLTRFVPLDIDLAGDFINGDMQTERVKDYIKLLQFRINDLMDLTGKDHVFMRSSTLSAKHSWKNSCFIQRGADLRGHIYCLVEHEAMAMRRSYYPSHLTIREFIPAKHYFYAFDGMPVTKEIRIFIKEGKIVHRQPYWPPEAIEDPVCFKGNSLSDVEVNDLMIQNHMMLAQDDECVDRQALEVSKFFPGYWSVDFMKGLNGKWYLIDMALGEGSYKWTQQ